MRGSSMPGGIAVNSTVLSALICGKVMPGLDAPANRFKRDVSGVTEDDDAPHASLRSRQTPFSTVSTEAITQHELAAGRRRCRFRIREGARPRTGADALRL
jgi:hypothetical protein